MRCYSRTNTSPLSLLLMLLGLCAAAEYHVKPKETSCPRESCYTMDELVTQYFNASATNNLMDNVTVIFLNGTHELKDSIFVREVNDFTMLGAGGIDGESHVEINCKSVSSLHFDGITNLTISRITFSKCSNALMFSNVFNLRLIWVVTQNFTTNSILAVNVFGASVIDHSVFHGLGYSGLFAYNRLYTVYIGYNNCSQILRKCSNKTKSLLHAVNHKLHIQNCVLRDGRNGSMNITLNNDCYN